VPGLTRPLDKSHMLLPYCWILCPGSKRSLSKHFPLGLYNTPPSSTPLSAAEKLFSASSFAYRRATAQILRPFARVFGSAVSLSTMAEAASFVRGNVYPNGVAVLTLDRPKALNAMNLGLFSHFLSQINNARVLWNRIAVRA
jgi:hypothetical protein